MAVTLINLGAVGGIYSATGTTDTNEYIFENPWPQTHNVVVTAVEASAGAAMLKYNYRAIANATDFSGLYPAYTADKTDTFRDEGVGVAQLGVDVTSGTWDVHVSLVKRVA